MPASTASSINAANIKTILIDLDDCLYDVEPIPQLMAQNIQNYMYQRLGFSKDGVAAVCADLYLGHGTTLAGLVARGYKIDYEDWHASVHGVLPYELVKPDEVLRKLLLAVPLPMWVFTNSDTVHAEKCLSLLGIRDCFQGVICFESTMAAAKAARIVTNGAPVVCKPNHQAFELALAAAGAVAQSTLFFDDSLRNIAAGKAVGMNTVLVRKDGAFSNSADSTIPSMLFLPNVLQQLGICSASESEASVPAAKSAPGLASDNGAVSSAAPAAAYMQSSSPAANGISAAPKTTKRHGPPADLVSWRQEECASAASPAPDHPGTCHASAASESAQQLPPASPLVPRLR